ncbi:conserved hypothetical protein [Theileria equi strain WA]|uniref:Uncharacterized protein n=1 Tax=Theileria equi strain WA TaxID=1537102 RepID=L1LCS2_THEEQ|nr:conserved hypothetical protein [Theileria equi strain WA]EKX73079.1 conserved hypothetical protein [Theileria equi strain WA]|eukprot:XP_004832531.1 conserved hypothetical protein [Theileria equi strain WA]
MLWSSGVRKLSSGLRTLPALEPAKDLETRRMIDKYHRYMFFFIGFALAANLNTSLLTETLFECDNFANKCNFSYFASGLAAFLLASFTLHLDFKSMLVFGWLFVPLQISLVLIGVFGEGVGARNAFIICYAVYGALEGFTLKSCTFVISRFFLNSTISILSAGYPASDIVLGCFQYLVEHLVGLETTSSIRLCLALCHLFQTVLTIIGLIWATVLYFKYSSRGSEETTSTRDEFSRFTQFLRVASHIRFYYPRVMLFGLTSFIVAFFFPCLIPFLFDISHTAKLVISLTFTLMDVIGLVYSSTVDETVDPSGRNESQSHISFLFFRDLRLYVAGVLALAICAFTLWARCQGDYEFVKSAEAIFFITVVTCFVDGYLYGRALNGCNPILEYYNTQVDEEGNKIVSDEIIEMNNTVNDVSMVLEYVFSAVSLCASNVTEELILKSLAKTA